MTATLIGGSAGSVRRLRRAASRTLAAVAVAGTALGWSATPAHATPEPAATRLTLVPDPGTTLWVDGRPYAGQVTVAPDGSGLAVVNRVSFEDYVAGIGEMPSNWPAAALQAQAVAARTYALWTVLTHPPGPGGGQICSSDYCQVYVGLAKTAGPDGAAWLAAVRATSGQVLTYGGRIIEAIYGSSDGGQTVSGGVPWLPSVADPQDVLAPEHRWSWSTPLTGLDGVLGVPAGETLASLVSTPTAIVETLRAGSGSTTTTSITPTAFHSLLNARLAAPAGLDLPLPSWRYSVSTYGPDARIAGLGDGQGMGMSQYGALGKADQGYTGAQILGSYYPGTALSRLPASDMPTTIAVTLDDPVSQAALQASGPIRMIGPSGRTEGSTTGPSSWEARPGGPGVELLSEPGGPPDFIAGAIPSSPPAPMTAPAPSAGRTAAPVTTPDRPLKRAAAPKPVETAYRRSTHASPLPMGWVLAGLLCLLTVCASFARVAQLGRLWTSGPVTRPAGDHYRSGYGNRRPTANG